MGLHQDVRVPDEQLGDCVFVPRPMVAQGADDRMGSGFRLRLSPDPHLVREPFSFGNGGYARIGTGGLVKCLTRTSLKGSRKHWLQGLCPSFKGAETATASSILRALLALFRSVFRSGS